MLSLIEYKTLVMRGDLEKANKVLPSIPKEHHNRFATFIFCDFDFLDLQALCVTDYVLKPLYLTFINRNNLILKTKEVSYV